MPERRAVGGAPAPPRRPAAPATREFPAGSYIVRMDQPYSRIADALLDYQYWAPNDPQTHPYDDTGWTFPEGFAVQAVRVIDAKVLDVPMERGHRATSRRRAASPARAAVVRDQSQRRQRADHAALQAEGRRHPGRRGAVRGRRREVRARIVHHPAASRRRISTRRRTSSASRRTRSSAAPVGEDAPGARGARRDAAHVDATRRPKAGGARRSTLYRIPYDYIEPQTIREHRDLRAKYDVILFGPGGGQASVDGMPMWRNAMPWNSPETPNIGTWAQTDDMRLGMGLEGLMHLRAFINAGGVFRRLEQQRGVRDHNSFTYGVSANRRAPSTRVVGSLLRTKLVDDTSPIVYGVPDNLAMYSDSGDSFTVSANVGGGGVAAVAAAARWRRRRPRRRPGRWTADRPRHARRPGRRAGTSGYEGIEPDAAAAAGSRCSRGSTRCRPRSS